jgi:hypothetical protein
MNLLFRLVGVGGVMPDMTVLPLLDPEPARAPALEGGRRANPEARDTLDLPALSKSAWSQALTISSAICRTRIAGSWFLR